MGLIKKYENDGITVEIYNDSIPKDINKRKENLVNFYDFINDISKKFDKETQKKVFLTDKQVEQMKKNGKYNFI